MAERFFVPGPLDRDRVLLIGAEAHHLARVRRMAVGDPLVLFDGSGVEAAGQVEAIGKGQVEVRVMDRSLVDRELLRPVVLATALPKGDRLAMLVEKATELGVARLVPLATRRSVVHPRAARLDRLRRVVVEASKQCGRNRLMELADPVAWADFCGWPAGAGCVRLIADPGGDPLFDHLAGARPPELRLAIGPEGGFTPDEVIQACGSGWQVVSLGPRILRIETAAIALAAVAVAALEADRAGSAAPPPPG